MGWGREGSGRVQAKKIYKERDESGKWDIPYGIICQALQHLEQQKDIVTPVSSFLKPKLRSMHFTFCKFHPVPKKYSCEHGTLVNMLIEGLECTHFCNSL